jgi:tetratricopeptide (TPR) repeat protein
MAAFEQVSSLSLSGRHRAADSFARSWTGGSDQEKLLLSATVALSAFADLHDPARLESARLSLEQLSRRAKGRTDPRSRLIEAMALSQESYLASLEGRDLASALDGRSAASVAQDLMDQGWDSPELRGIVGGYLFWKSQSLGPLGRLFGGDQRDRGLLLTRQAAASRSPFREAFRTSLLWIRYERGEYAEALRVVREARAIWPDNRLYRQAEGDVLFRLNRLPEALDTYRTSFREYQDLETLPVGRLSAAGNLARIHAAMGQRDSARAWLDTLDATRYRAVRRWLPASLVRDLAPVRRELSRP